MTESGATPKKVKKVEGSSAFADERDYDKEIQKCLQEIDACQNEVDIINEKASDDILDVERKYNVVRNPLYEKRNDIIKRIPSFWVTTFVNHPQISSMIDEDEENCLHFLSKLEVKEFEDIKAGYKIAFHFDENPYFENDVLTKEFHMSVAGEESCRSTVVRWKEGNAAKRMRNKNVGKGRKRMIQQNSFFHWLTDNCYSYASFIAEMIKDDIWPNPLKHYLVPEEGNDLEEEDEATDEEVNNSDLAEDELKEEEDVGKGGSDDDVVDDDYDDDDDDEVLVEENGKEGKELGEVVTEDEEEEDEVEEEDGDDDDDEVLVEENEKEEKELGEDVIEGGGDDEDDDDVLVEENEEGKELGEDVTEDGGE